MSRSSTTATTTYPFTFTTYSNPSPTSFPPPTGIPTNIFSFGPANECSKNTDIHSEYASLPTSYPQGRPVGLQAACVISNDANVNNHAFADLYECCTGGDIGAMGSPFPCTAQCWIKDNQTFQELGECLSKRSEIVICSPQYAEIGRNQTEESLRRSSILAAQSTSSQGGAGATGQSTNAGNPVGVVHATTSKAGWIVFGILTLGSVAGMML